MRGQNAIPHQRHEEILQFWTGHSRAKPLGPVTFNGSAIQKWFAGGPEVDQVSYSVSKPSITESGQLLTPRHGWQSWIPVAWCTSMLLLLVKCWSRFIEVSVLGLCCLVLHGSISLLEGV